MSQNAYIKLVEGSAVPSVTLDDLQELFTHYKEQLTLTGQQVEWDYGDKGFPYRIEKHQDGDNEWFVLRADSAYYKYMVAAVGIETAEGGDQHYIQIALPQGATHADKAKANEFCKHLARKLKAELHLFNGRVMYYNPRK